MSEVVYIADHNPALFLQQLADSIRNGFYADDSVQGAPFLSIVNEIRLVEGDEPALRHPELADKDEVHITAYDPTLYILDIQDLIIQGFDVVPETVQLHDLPFTVTMQKRATPKLDIQKATKPAAKGPEKKPAKVKEL